MIIYRADIIRKIGKIIEEKKLSRKDLQKILNISSAMAGYLLRLAEGNFSKRELFSYLEILKNYKK